MILVGGLVLIATVLVAKLRLAYKRYATLEEQSHLIGYKYDKLLGHLEQRVTVSTPVKNMYHGGDADVRRERDAVRDQWSKVERADGAGAVDRSPAYYK